MKWLHVFGIIFGVVLLFGCASTEKYDANLSTLIGQPSSDLIAKMGPPSAKKILSNGDEVWAYTKIDDVYVPSEFYLYDQGALSNEYGGMYAPFMDQYDFSPYEQNTGYVVEYSCQTAFIIKNNVIVGWKWVGNSCVG